MKNISIIALLIFFISTQNLVGASHLKVFDLRCENRVSPMGVDTQNPHLSWNLESTKRAQTQSAYRILVASTLDQLNEDKGDLWDSSKVESSRQLHIPYEGSELRSGQMCYWKVRSWDRQGNPSPWSPAATWTMGVLKPVDWQGAQWVGVSDESRNPSTMTYTHCGFHSDFSDNEDSPKWVLFDLGEETSLSGVRFDAVTSDGKTKLGKGYLYPQSYKIEVSNNRDFSDAITVLEKTTEKRPKGFSEQHFKNFKGKKARYLKLTVTKLAKAKNGKYAFALSELMVMNGDNNVGAGKKVKASGSLEDKDAGWSLDYINDDLRAYIPARPSSTLRLRKPFETGGKPVRATVNISGLGFYELSINGKKVGNLALDPGFTTYDQRTLYTTYDVSGLIESGRNSIAVELGNGWYSMPTPDCWGFEAATWTAPPKLLFKLHLEYADGSRRTVISDPSWKYSTDGPRVYNCIRGGETYDARKADPGWRLPSYDDSQWKAVEVLPAPAGKLQAQAHPPIRITKTIRPVAITEPKPNVYVFDFGENTTGWAVLKARGSRGSKVTLRYHEALFWDGTCNMGNLSRLTKGRYQKGEYIFAGNGVEGFEPRFTYHGFRYIQVEGLTEKPTRETLLVKTVHTDPEVVGHFSCSNKDVNQIQDMILRTQLTNIHGIPTDCPQREKVGWTGDGYISAEAAIFNFYMPEFYKKWWFDMRDVQDENGHASCIAPTGGEWGRSRPNGKPHKLSDPWWGGALVRLPWKHYRYYGDIRLLEQAYEPMKQYLGYVATQSKNFISWGNEGDWVEEGVGGFSRRTPPKLAGTAAYYYHAKIVAQVAELLGKPDEAAHYVELSARINQSFHDTYFDREKALYAEDSQTAHALPLLFGMTPKGKRAQVIDNLVHNITNVRDGHISSGIIGTYYTFLALMEAGHDDVAYTMLTQPDYPGWIHMLKNGGTTIWERWKGNGSQNHPALGSIGSWFYQALGGIRLNEGSPAFKYCRIEPSIVGDLRWVKSSHRSLYGKIESNWSIEGDQIRMEINIPVNTTAKVRVPCSDSHSITESGHPVLENKDLSYASSDEKSSYFEIGSGLYVFEAPYKRAKQ